MAKAGLHKRPAFLAYHWFWRTLDWFFPPTCAGCGRVGERWCAGCQGLVVRLPDAVCPSCGEPQRANVICRRCTDRPPAYQALRSMTEFGGVIREGIHKLKYKGNIGMGEALAGPLIDFAAQLGWDYDLVIPVPLSAVRFKERGYNQAALLARPLALAFGKEYSGQALARIRDTASQVDLSMEERRLNVAGAFQAARSRVERRSILVVDDVTTTGSTIEACAEALISRGAAAVYGLTLARSIYRGRQPHVFAAAPQQTIPSIPQLTPSSSDIQINPVVK